MQRDLKLRWLLRCSIGSGKLGDVLMLIPQLGEQRTRIGVGMKLVTGDPVAKSPERHRDCKPDKGKSPGSEQPFGDGSARGAACLAIGARHHRRFIFRRHCLDNPFRPEGTPTLFNAILA